MTNRSLTLSKPSAESFCSIELTGSKSESNRALILNALSKGKVGIRNLSLADDTAVMQESLKNAADHVPLINIGPAGTAMRFLSAYFAVTGTETTLTGTERMKQRPIGILVNALRELGAIVDYAEEEGFPPLAFHKGFNQKNNKINIRGNVSSQYITALLLVAAALPEGLELNIEGELTSRPYVEMTLSMLSEAGISYQWKENVILIPSRDLGDALITVEPDWSAASYWYSIAALSDAAAIKLPWLKKSSLQGDSRISSIMEHFGVSTEFTDGGIEISKVATGIKGDLFDLKDCPDLAQTVIVCSAALGHNATFTGLETLKIKETDRIAALQNELGKIGVKLHEDNGFYHLDCSGLHFPETVRIDTYEDHRMAMAFAPLALKIPNVIIEDPAVVGKSYPSFWNDLEKAGFFIIDN